MHIPNILRTPSPILSHPPDKASIGKGQKLLPETRQRHGEMSKESLEFLMEIPGAERSRQAWRGKHGRSLGLALPWEEE